MAGRSAPEQIRCRHRPRCASIARRRRLAERCAAPPRRARGDGAHLDRRGTGAHDSSDLPVTPGRTTAARRNFVAPVAALPEQGRSGHRRAPRATRARGEVAGPRRALAARAGLAPRSSAETCVAVDATFVWALLPPRRRRRPRGHGGGRGRGSATCHAMRRSSARARRGTRGRRHAAPPACLDADDVPGAAPLERCDCRGPRGSRRCRPRKPASTCPTGPSSVDALRADGGRIDRRATRRRGGSIVRPCREPLDHGSRRRPRGRRPRRDEQRARERALGERAHRHARIRLGPRATAAAPPRR